MNRKVGVAALIVAALATGGVAIAQDRHGFGGRDGGFWGQGHGDRGHARGMGRFGGFRGGAGLEGLMELYDQNDDGALTQDEIDTVRAERLQQFDSNGDGSLSLEEYQALWLDAMRERMVDQFQRHDDDGDGLVTAEEFGERQAKMVARMDRNDDGKIDAEDFQRRPWGMNGPRDGSGPGNGPRDGSGPGRSE